MINKGLLLVCVMMTVSACGLFGDKTPPPPPPPPPPPEPTLVIIQVVAASDINPNAAGRPSPLVMRIYQLKSYSDFKDADFYSLSENDAGVLGGELIARKEIILEPDMKDTIMLEDVSDKTRTIGFMGLFRDEEARWRAAEGIQPNKTTVIHVYASGITLTSRLQVNQPNP